MIQKPISNPGAQIIDIIRGRAPLTALSDVGIEVTDVEGKLILHSSMTSPVKPSIRDVLRGFRLYQAYPERLRLWSFLLLSETSIDLSELEESDPGDFLLEALWDASADGVVPDDLL